MGLGKPPQPILERFIRLGKYLQNKGFVLRSGAADGAFEQEVSYKHIFLPWPSYNNHTSNFYNIDERCYQIASEIHPYWSGLKDSVRKLHARNVFQCLGPNLDTPSQFLVCWTENGETKGGTATAIRLAEKFNIPIFNFGRAGDDKKLWQLIK